MNEYVFLYIIFPSLHLPGSFLFLFLLHKSLHLFAFLPGWFLFSCRYGFSFLFMSSFLFLLAHYLGGGVCRFFSSGTFLFFPISSHWAGIFLHLFPSISPFKISNPLFAPLSGRLAEYTLWFSFPLLFIFHFFVQFFFSRKYIKNWLGLDMWILTN